MLFACALFALLSLMIALVVQNQFNDKNGRKKRKTQWKKSKRGEGEKVVQESHKKDALFL
jgi:hypothetical protein